MSSNIKAAVVHGTKRAFTVTTGVSISDKYINALIYGAYGVGKTILAGTSVDVPEMRDVIFFDIEAGTKPLRTVGAVKNHADIDFIRITEYEQFVAATQFLMRHCRARDNNDAAMLAHIAGEFGVNPSRRYRTVIVDSIYELDGINFRRLIGDKADDLMQSNPSDDLRGDYGRNRQVLLKSFRSLRNLPMNVLLIAPDDIDKDEHTKRITVGPKLTGKLSKDIQGFMDTVGFLHRFEQSTGDAKTSIRRLYLQSNGKFDAKNRLAPQEVTHIDDPTMAKIWATLTRSGPNAGTGSKPVSKPGPTAPVKPSIPQKRS